MDFLPPSRCDFNIILCLVPFYSFYNLDNTVIILSTKGFIIVGQYVHITNTVVCGSLCTSWYACTLQLTAAIDYNQGVPVPKMFSLCYNSADHAEFMLDSEFSLQ